MPPWDRSNEQLLEMIKTGSPSDKMAVLLTLTEDIGLAKLKLFLERTNCLKTLLDVLNDESAAIAEDQLDWRSAGWELLLLVLHNQEFLGLDVTSVAIAPVLSLVETGKDRRKALQFLLTEPNRSSAGQAAIVDSGGISLLVDVLRSEREDETLALLLELLHNIAASSSSHVQEIDLVVQNIVDCSQSDALDFTLLLLIVYHERLPPYESTGTPVDRQKQLSEFALQASVDVLNLASSSPAQVHRSRVCAQCSS